jgi:hypothetical protein
LYTSTTLVAEKSLLGALFATASNANLIVAVLAQIFVQLLEALYSQIFDVLRWQLLSTAHGAPMLQVFQMAGSTGLWGTLKMVFTSGAHRIWTWHRFVFFGI